MTEEELRLELECYRDYVNPDCDIDNMTTEERREFYKLYRESKDYFKKIMEDEK